MIDTIMILLLIAGAFTLGTLLGMGLLYHYCKKAIDRHNKNLPY